MKEDLKKMLIIMLISCYFVNLIVMFFYPSLEILIANIIAWLVIVLCFFGIAFVFWLNN